MAHLRDLRARIVAAAVALIAEGGRHAATTRAVAAAAGVQPPAIYRQFGDMRGLLDAAAGEVLAAYVREKAARAPSDDPVAELRHGWDLHVAFGLAHPALYALIYGGPDDVTLREAARAGEAHLHALVSRVAAAGRLRVSVPHATRLIAAAGNGATLALIAAEPAARDPRLSDAMREAVLAAVTVGIDPAPDTIVADSPTTMVAMRAVALRAVLAEEYAAAPLTTRAQPDARAQAALADLSPAERQLLGEWLDRLAGAGS